MTGLIVAGAILVLLVFIFISISNTIVRRKNAVDQAYGSVEIYLKKRFDTLPNLISLLKKYMSHEKETLEKVTQLRSERASSMNDQIEASNELTAAFSGLLANKEEYPDLKADKQFLTIEYELMELEGYISAARRSYNAAVTHFNNTIEQFPNSIVANFRKETKAKLLEIPKEEQVSINVSDHF